ncbi:hypothetical protein [Peribacillus frigoritolerans]|uniref:hypothetical protein n=1 Tax=Peribacillus frigoritolerans TaxID=450367 RepID=UPI002E1C0C04|nr:hypothetical protein [Peribacillus frigoritolerans]
MKFCEESNRILGYEIKTSRTVNKFHITYNELQKAHMMKYSYYLFFIFIEEGVNEYYGYIIQNPIKELQLNFLELTEPVHTGNAAVIPNQFRISMELEYLEQIKCDIILNKRVRKN